jgi:hypothetical protein
VNSVPGVFDWYLVSTDLYVMVCDINP